MKNKLIETQDIFIPKPKLLVVEFIVIWIKNVFSNIEIKVFVSFLTFIEYLVVTDEKYDSKNIYMMFFKLTNFSFKINQ